MQPFSKHTGLVIPIDRVNVDTDQMVPKQFIKLQTKHGFGRVLFYDWRYLPGEKPNPDCAELCRYFLQQLSKERYPDAHEPGTPCGRINPADQKTRRIFDRHRSAQ